MKAKQVELPHTLIEAVKDKRVVLVFGAGASKECVNLAGDRPPDGNQMRDRLAKKFLGTEGETRDLMTISEMAISSGAGQTQVFEDVADMVSGFNPSDAHKAIADFSWRGLATTNYDKLIEQGFAENASRKQTCLPFVKDIEPYEDRLQKTQNAVALMKLHGCVDHRLDRDIPLILSHEHYHRHTKNRKLLLQRLQDWAQTSVLVFVGYKLADSHIRSLVYDIDPGKRPQWYIVAPGGDEHDKRFWAGKNIDVIQTTFGGFTDALHSSIEPLFRSLSSLTPTVDEPYQKHFRSADVGSDSFRQSLKDDLEFVHSGVSYEEISPKKFYSGYETGWCGIVRRFDFRRRVGERLLFSAIEDDEQIDQKFLLLHGSAGSGKTIALRKAAYDAAVSLDQMVYWLRRNGQARIEVFEELYGLTGNRTILFVDQVSLHCSNILELLTRAKDLNIPLTVIAAEREADWGSYCQELEGRFPPEVFQLQNLSQAEAEDLVALLERHGCLGMLEKESHEKRISAFMDENRSDRQLLVALHELTQGKPFETIIGEEYERILPEAAKRLYLDISTMHQFGVTARAGAISRISGIRFSDFENDFFQPLSDIVNVTWDNSTGDRGYETRHARVANMVFGIVCNDDEAKSAQYKRIISGLDAGFSSDERILQGICKGRTVAQQFSSINPAREIFEAACKASPSSAFLFQQAAILEYSHSGGSLDRAEELALEARAIDDNNHIYIQTLAEISRRKANATNVPVRKAQLRSQSRKYLDEIWLRNPFKDSTFCNLLVDEAIDLLAAMSDEPLEHEVLEFDAKVSDAVNRIARANQDNPDQSEFSGIEARLWERLGETEKASNSLKKAIKAKPKNSSVFLRLAKIERSSPSAEGLSTALKEGLAKFPEDKSLHLQMALSLVEAADHPDSATEFHFRSSFGTGDHNFDARFYYAAYLFWAGKPEESQKLFDEIDRRAPSEYRNTAPRHEDAVSQKLGRFTGTVEGKKERYFFIRFGGYPNAIFSFWKSLEDEEYDLLKLGDQLSFKLRFNRRGPVAVQVKKPKH